MKLIKRIVAVILIIASVLLACNKTNAANIGEIKKLKRGPLGYYCVQKWDGNKWIYLTYNTTSYKDSNGKEYTAYCLSPGAPGVGYVSGEKDSYNVKIKGYLEDDRIWRIVSNGYPYKTVNELGVENVDDAYFATMQAVNCVLRGYTLEQAKQLYSPGQFAINGENIEDIKRRGEKTLNAMFNLIDIGLNGKESRSSLMNIEIVKVSDFIKENNEYYSQSFKIRSNSGISKYNIEKIENVTNGTYVSDTKGIKKNEFYANEVFKVMIPANEIKNNINGKIHINVLQKNYPIYYGISELEGFQDYALCNEEYENINVNCAVDIKADESKLYIDKVDSDSNKPLGGVKFSVNGPNQYYKEFTTNRDGKIQLENLFPGEYTIKELEAQDSYELNDEEILIKIDYKETKSIEVKNKLKKGNLKIIKTDYDDTSIKLKDVKFELKNQKGNVISEGSTDDNGEVLFQDLLEGNYILKETETLEDYMLKDDELTVVVKNNETSEIKVRNKKVKVVEVPVIQEKIVEVPVIEEKIVPKEKIVEVDKIVEVKVPVEKIIYKELPKTGYNKIDFKSLNLLLLSIRKLLSQI